jgi:hypothetical protein
MSASLMCLAGGNGLARAVRTVSNKKMHPQEGKHSADENGGPGTECNPKTGG